MLQAIVKVVNNFKAVQAAAKKAAQTNLFRSAAGVRKDAIASIERSPGASEPGKPPHSRRGALQRAILYSVDKQNMSAVIGPAASKVSASASAHEHGLIYKGQEYPERPFMGPALEGRYEQFAGSFAGSIGS